MKWKQRNHERKAEIAQFGSIERTKPAIGGDFTRAQMTDAYFEDLERRLGLGQDFNETVKTPAEEQNNERDEGQDRD